MSKTACEGEESFSLLGKIVPPHTSWLEYSGIFYSDDPLFSGQSHSLTSRGGDGQGAVREMFLLSRSLLSARASEALPWRIACPTCRLHVFSVVEEIVSTSLKQLLVNIESWCVVLG